MRNERNPRNNTQPVEVDGKTHLVGYIQLCILRLLNRQPGKPLSEKEINHELQRKAVLRGRRRVLESLENNLNTDPDNPIIIIDKLPDPVSSRRKLWFLTLREEVEVEFPEEK
jgi:hypothetical protein